MKAIIITIILAILNTSGLFSQQETDIARINKVNGVPVYIFNEPLNEYEVVTTKGTGGKAGSILTAGVVNEGISAKVTQYVKRLSKYTEKKDLLFDAILYTNGKQAAAIKFKDGFDQEKKDLARVRSVNGTYVFAMCEPLRDYSIIIDKSGGAKVGSYLSGGLANKGIEGDLTQFVRRLKRSAEEEGKKIDAIIYNAGKRAIGISFD